MVRTTDKSTKPKNPRRTSLRLEIIKKAATLFQRRGYRAVSVDDIVDEVGISKPTFYSYLERKDDILWEICDSIGVDARQRARKILASEQDARDRLRAFIRSHVEDVALKREFYAVYFQEEAELPRRLKKKFESRELEYRTMIEDLLRQGIEEGLFPNVDPKIAALGLLGMCNWVCKWYRPDGELSPAEIADNYLALLTGLGQTGQDNEVARHS